MKKATTAAEANKKSGKKYECGHCGVKCNDDYETVRQQVYMGRPTKTISTSHYCGKDCLFASAREEFITMTEGVVEKLEGYIAELKPGYLQAISGKFKDKSMAELGITLFNYTTSKRAFLKALYARKPRQELEMKWFKYQKYIGEMMEDAHDNAEALSKYSNELKVFGNRDHIDTFACD